MQRLPFGEQRCLCRQVALCGRLAPLGQTRELLERRLDDRAGRVGEAVQAGEGDHELEGRVRERQVADVGDDSDLDFDQL